MRRGLATDLAGEDEALEVAAREQPGLRVDRWRSDLVGVLSRSAAPGADGPVSTIHPRPMGGLPIALHHEVVRERQVRRAADAVCGPQARVRRPRRWPRGRTVGQSSTSHDGHCRVQGRSPVMTSASSLWPLPATPAMPTISPARTSSETSRSAGETASLRPLTSASGEDHGPGSPACVDGLEHVAADHEAARGSASSRRRPGCRGGHPSPAHDGDPVRDRQDLVQLVADEHDRLRPRRSSHAGCGTARRSPAARARRWARP